MENRKNILEIANLTKSYGDQKILDNINLKIAPGRVVGLLGEEGSGKTTLIKIITGLIHDYKGVVRITGKPLGYESKKLVSYLPDKEFLPDWLKVQEIIDLYKNFYKDFDHIKATKLLKRFNIDFNKKASELSSGMYHVLMLILVMSRKVYLYVLDEPLSDVDPATREIILSIIFNNFNENSSIILSTNIISDVEIFFDEVIFLKDKNIYLHYSAKELRRMYKMTIDKLFKEVYRWY